MGRSNSSDELGEEANREGGKGKGNELCFFLIGCASPPVSWMLQVESLFARRLSQENSAV